VKWITLRRLTTLAASGIGATVIHGCHAKPLAGFSNGKPVATPAFARACFFRKMLYMLSKIPMGRFRQVEQLASLICRLGSEECSFSTGAVLGIGGGRGTH
jgi:NAD(P)-dependent dehydrogenase (short-subunit alcohol dehydrogenase family)